MHNQCEYCGAEFDSDSAESRCEDCKETEVTVKLVFTKRELRELEEIANSSNMDLTGFVQEVISEYL